MGRAELQKRAWGLGGGRNTSVGKWLSSINLNNKLRTLWGSENDKYTTYCKYPFVQNVNKVYVSLDCSVIICLPSGAHILLDDETDMGYVEDGTPCGPSMMCLDRKCLHISSLNISSCPMGSNDKVCSGHGVS